MSHCACPACLAELGYLAEALVYYVPEVLDGAGITDEGQQLLANMGTCMHGLHVHASNGEEPPSHPSLLYGCRRGSY